MSYYSGKNDIDVERGNGGKLYPAMQESPQLRWAFIRKVYCILFMQLLITFGVSFIMFIMEPVREFMHTFNGFVAMIAVTILMVIWLFVNYLTTYQYMHERAVFVLLMMHCFSRRHPWNYILMFLFTLSMAFVVGAICSQRTGEAVLMATGTTVLVSFALTLFTFFAACRGYDFSFLGPFLLCASLLLMTFGIIRIIFPMGNVMTQVYGCLGALLFSAYIIYDTDNVIKRFNYDQYIEAAAALYLDIINLFLSLLEIFDGSRS